jgi:hypothetical protein
LVGIHLGKEQLLIDHQCRRAAASLGSYRGWHDSSQLTVDARCKPVKSLMTAVDKRSYSTMILVVDV